MQQPDLWMALPFNVSQPRASPLIKHTEKQGTAETEHCGNVLQKQLGGLMAS